MLNFRQFVRPLIPVAAVVILCLVATPAAEANNGASSQKAATSVTAPEQQDANKQTNQPPAQKPSQKSVLDADMLERPLSFFKNSYNSDEDEDSDDMFSHSSTVVIAVKALVASLLSTII